MKMIEFSGLEGSNDSKVNTFFNRTFTINNANCVYMKNKFPLEEYPKFVIVLLNVDVQFKSKPLLSSKQITPSIRKNVTFGKELDRCLTDPLYCYCFASFVYDFLYKSYCFTNVETSTCVTW